MVFDLYRAVRKKEKKNRAISNAHYMSFFPSDWHFCPKSSRLPLSFSPQPWNPSHLFRFIITETHSTCPLTGIQFFLYLCIPLFIRNHMLMKSVIINLKYLIFRSVSASEGGWVEEQQSGEEGGGGWKEPAVASAISASAALKSAPTKAKAQQCFSTLTPSEV